MLAGEADLQVVAELGGYDDLGAVSPTPGPNVAVLGLNPPTAEGLAAVSWLAEHVPGCAVLLVTGVEGTDRIRRALDGSADNRTVKGIVGTDNTPAQLLHYIRRAAAGERVVDPRLAAAQRASRNPLTRREREILRLAATGMPDPEIAGRQVVLDGWSWLNGNGLALEVMGDATGGLTLPMRWKVESAPVLA